MSRTISRRELLRSGAIGGAALVLPLPEALAAVRRNQPRDSVHCLRPADRFGVAEIIPNCSFAAFSPDGRRIALETPNGIEMLNRDDGSRVAVTPPGFTLSGKPWHPAGGTLIASGPASDGSGPYLHAISAAGVTRLLPSHPGAARAAFFSPDGRKVAFTYLNRFVHQLCMANWRRAALADPRNLIPIQPATEGSLDLALESLAFHETRAFSADGRRLYYASDSRAGMLNVSIHFIDLATGRRNRVTFDEGYAEGLVLAPDNAVLYAGTTRAREPGFLTMVSGPAVPSFLGFAAAPTLHDQLAAKRLALIGNGDILAMDSTYGLHARMVGNRRPIAKKLNQPVSRGSYRLIACSMSPDGTELAVAAISSLGGNVVLLRRRPRTVPAPVAVRRSRTPPGSAPLAPDPVAPVDRTMESRRGGRVTLRLDGDISAGSFEMALENFSLNGIHVFAGTAAFRTGGGGFRHTGDVRHVKLESQEEVNVFYRADMQVDWRGEGLAASPASSGVIESDSRSGTVSAAWDGAAFAPQNGWNAGDRGPRHFPGSEPCRRAGER